MTNVKVHHEPRPVEAEQGVVYSLPGDFFGYFGWPTVARLHNGDLVVVASGFRNAHVDPFGRTVLLRSYDEGRTWTTPQVINDLPIDDRDAGIVDLGGGRLLVSWFTSDTCRYPIADDYQEMDDPEAVRHYASGFRRLTPGMRQRWLGSWTRLSEDDGATWSEPLPAPVTAPHGPIYLAEEDTLLYLGKLFTHGRQKDIQAFRSEDRGHTWHCLGTVPLHPETVPEHYHEPHVVALSGDRILGLIRIQEHGEAPSLPDTVIPHFSMGQTTSDDGGRTWTTVEPLGFHGSPPHVIRHSSGALVTVYGYRLEPFGERAMMSHDDGVSWEAGYILREDGVDGDLGYPSSVELSDGSLLTVYYQKRNAGEPCSLCQTRWTLP
ncbi:MAG: sialidase family protein [Anaerolineae bacterium]